MSLMLNVDILVQYRYIKSQVLATSILIFQYIAMIICVLEMLKA